MCEPYAVWCVCENALCMLYCKILKHSWMKIEAIKPSGTSAAVPRMAVGHFPKGVGLVGGQEILEGTVKCGWWLAALWSRSEFGPVVDVARQSQQQ